MPSPSIDIFLQKSTKKNKKQKKNHILFMKKDIECEYCTALVLSLTINDVVGANNYIQHLIVGL